MPLRTAAAPRAGARRGARGAEAARRHNVKRLDPLRETRGERRGLKDEPEGRRRSNGQVVARLTGLARPPRENASQENAERRCGEKPDRQRELADARATSATFQRS